jgi:oligoribonuclease NrnB/cAMP/cGMP phosphodiesterase (DHH superfamily)
MLMPDVVVYHAGCWDGFAAAATAHRACEQAGQPTPALVAARYGDPLPGEIDGATVFVVDFSYPPEEMVELVDRAASVVWIDHHVSAIAAIADGPGIDMFTDTRLDTERSGAVLTWDYFHGRDWAAPPSMVSYVQDRDLWLFERPDSREVAAWMKAQPRTLEDWERMLWTPLDEAAGAGREILKFERVVIENVVGTAWWAELAGWEMPVASAVYDIGSDTAARLIEVTGSPVAAYVVVDGAGFRYGLRSDGSVDVSVLAGGFGGGGHRSAAGFLSGERVDRVLRPLAP